MMYLKNNIISVTMCRIEKSKTAVDEAVLLRLLLLMVLLLLMIVVVSSCFVFNLSTS
jgi:hypothetical protein